MLHNCATQCSLQSAGRKLCWSAVTRQVLKCTVEEEESPVKWYEDSWPWFYASHVGHRILVALGEFAGIMEIRFTVPEHNCIVLCSALWMMFSLNTIVIGVRTSKRMILVNVPSLLLHPFVLFFFVMIIEDIYFSLLQPKVFFIVVLVIIVSASLHSHVFFSLSVLLLNMNCSGEADTTNWIIGVEMKNLENLEGVCKSSPGDAVSCEFISVEVFCKDS